MIEKMFYYAEGRTPIPASCPSLCQALQAQEGKQPMLTLDYKLDGSPAQYAAIDEGIRVVQFIRNTCLRAWMDHLPEGKSFEAMSRYTATLANEFAFAGRLGSQARQASAGRAWAAVSRFYGTCQKQIPGKKGYPRFQHDCRSIEYKETAGWRLSPDGKHITFSDGVGIGTVRLIGTRLKPGVKKTNQSLRSPAAYALSTIKRVRIVRRADGYFCQFCIAVCRVQAHADTGVERGIDVGLSAYYTDSEGQKVKNPRFFRETERKVTRLQRQVSRPERAAQTDQEAESHTQAQYLPERAARCKTTTPAAEALAHPAQERADDASEPAAKPGGPAGGPPGKQPEYPA